MTAAARHMARRQPPSQPPPSQQRSSQQALPQQSASQPPPSQQRSSQQALPQQSASQPPPSQQRLSLQSASQRRSSRQGGRPKRSRARICGGALALALGVGMGIPAAQALWWVEESLPGPQIQLGVVAFSAGRASSTSADPIQPLKDGDGENDFSVHAGYEERHEDDEGADVGTTLSQQLTEDDAEALEDGQWLYIKYVVNGQAEGNSQLTYVPDLSLPVDGEGDPIQAGWTANSVILLYLVGPEDPEDPVNCQAFFEANPTNPKGIKYNGDGKAPVQVGEDLDALVNFDQETNQQVWCLKAVPSSLARENKASITVDAGLDAPKEANDSWTATIADRSADGDDQMFVSFTPTVSRWELDE